MIKLGHPPASYPWHGTPGDPRAAGSQFVSEGQAGWQVRSARGETIGPAAVHTAVPPVSTASLRSLPVSVEGSS